MAKIEESLGVRNVVTTIEMAAVLNSLAILTTSERGLNIAILFDMGNPGRMSTLASQKPL